MMQTWGNDAENSCITRPSRQWFIKTLYYDLSVGGLTVLQASSTKMDVSLLSLRPTSLISLFRRDRSNLWRSLTNDPLK